jgi:hypothetical protein
MRTIGWTFGEGTFLKFVVDDRPRPVCSKDFQFFIKSANSQTERSGKSFCEIDDEGRDQGSAD